MRFGGQRGPTDDRGRDTSVEDCFPPDGTCATCSAKGWSAEQLAIGIPYFQAAIDSARMLSPCQNSKRVRCHASPGSEPSRFETRPVQLVREASLPTCGPF